jgi:hypothetical protein
MDYKGQNGFLNVLMVLKWWRDALEVASPDWEEAVSDITWVLQKMKECVLLVVRWISLAKTVLRATTRPSSPVANVSNIAAAVGTAGGAQSGNSRNGLVAMPVTENAVNSGAKNIVESQPQAQATPRHTEKAGATPNTERPVIPKTACRGPGSRIGTEGLSQEELDEMDEDPDADMEA